nr:hypothetical protein [Tanacetum cinerariifolium]
MPSKSAPFTQATMHRMIKESVDAAIAAERARHANARNDARRSGPVRGHDAAPAVRECTFAGFMKCNPTAFHGIKGSVILRRWFEKTKSVLGSVNVQRERSRRNQRMEYELWNLKVKEYNIMACTQRFNELALMCPGMVKPEGVKVNDYIWGLPDNIKGEVTSSKPVNLNEAVRMAHKLMEQKSQARDERILERKKRKWENYQSGNSSGISSCVCCAIRVLLLSTNKRKEIGHVRWGQDHMGRSSKGNGYCSCVCVCTGKAGKVGTSQRIESSEDEKNVFNQGRISVDIDEGIELVDDQEKDAQVKGRQADTQAEIYNIDLDHTSKVLSMQEDSEVQEVVEVVNAAKLMTEVATTAVSIPIPAAEPAVVAISAVEPAAKPKVLKIVLAAPAVSTKKRKGVVIRDPEEELHDDTSAETQSAKDKGKGILVEDPKPMKKKDQIAMDAERYHGYKKKPQSESKARKNMIAYLKNTEGFKMVFFKGKTYDQILPIFQARFDANMRFLLKSKEEMEKEEEEIIKSINETPAQKAAKRRRLIILHHLLLELMLLKRPKENTKCVSAAGEELTAAKHKLKLVLVTKPHNKTPYELLHGRLPSIGFMRPFGCPVTILNTLDSLGKFQERLMKDFLLDTLSATMNYHPVLAENQSNPTAGFQYIEKAGEEGTQTYVLFPVLSDGSTNPKNNKDAHTGGNEHNDDIQKSVSPDIHSLSCGDQAREQGNKAVNKDKGKSPVVTITRFRDLNEEFAECINYSSNDVSVAGPSFFAAGLDFTNST